MATRDDPSEPFQAKGDPGPAFRSLAFQFSSIGFAVSARFRNSLVPFGIEPRQFALLRAVGFSGGQSQKALAEHLAVPTSSMVATVDDLEQRGLIERRSTDDRRVRALHLTQDGRELLQKVLPVAMRSEQAIRDALTGDEANELSELLNKVGTVFGLAPGNAHSSLKHEDN